MAVLRIVPWSTREAGEPLTDDARLVAGMVAREPWATAALIDRYGRHVDRVLLRVLGAGDTEQADLAQEVFVRAWEGIARLENPGALRSWLTNIAVFAARELIRRRRRRRWLSFSADLPDSPTTWARPEIAEAARAVYAIFDRMPVDERLPFSLRMLEGLSIEETADACGMTVATVRRRLAKAEHHFFQLARRYEALGPWLAERARATAATPVNEMERS